MDDIQFCVYTMSCSGILEMGTPKENEKYSRRNPHVLNLSVPAMPQTSCHLSRGHSPGESRGTSSPSPGRGSALPPLKGTMSRLPGPGLPCPPEGPVAAVGAALLQWFPSTQVPRNLGVIHSQQLPSPSPTALSLRPNTEASTSAPASPHLYPDPAPAQALSPLRLDHCIPLLNSLPASSLSSRRTAARLSLPGRPSHAPVWKLPESPHLCHRMQVSHLSLTCRDLLPKTPLLPSLPHTCAPLTPTTGNEWPSETQAPWTLPLLWLSQDHLPDTRAL